ncbi:MAG: cytochrome c [Calditrichaeota bacterium]|nr:MAG: cytochrome c [Calditrichota bacterium]
MSKDTKRNRLWFIGIVLIMFGTITISGLVGCASGLTQKQKPGAMLWGENCGRCHNVRNPKGLNDAQWDVAVMHMRTRANLTADEAQKILEFLQSAN